MGYACIIALCFGCLFAYVSGSSLVLMGVMGIGARYYGALFAATSAGFVIGSFANAFLNRRGVSHSVMISWGLTTIASLAVVLLLLALVGFLAPATLIGLVIVSHVAHSIVRANSTQAALEPVPEIAGVASAVLTGLQMIVGAAASAIAATLFDGHTAIAMTATMSTCAVGAFVIHRLVVRPAERRMLMGHERVPHQIALPHSLPITEVP
jgi:DHA1 family bicyclomycin/chloramphenicol resistance-like MFS transporter